MKQRRYSRQREQIYQTVCGMHNHPTAQMVYDALRPEMPNLSLGTVYRNLQQMAEEGRLRELSGPVARFDADLYPHTHVCCQRCGQVADAVLPYDSALDAAACVGGWTVNGHSLTFHGICPVCGGIQYNEERMENIKF